MHEEIYNFFYYVEDNEIIQLGYAKHLIAGTDDDKSNHLKSSVDTDSKKAVKLSPPKKYFNQSGKFTLQHFMALSRQGKVLEVFEGILSKLGASKNPLCCTTAIVNGQPEIDISTSLGPLYLSKHQGHPKLGGGVMSDYLEDYMKPEGFDMPALIHDDYFEAIKLLFNKGHYVSCMKLLASSIDTISFLEYGDVHGNFIKWLNNYSNLASIEITPSQLWELRNSILHMSNLDSRKVLQGKEKRISFCVAKSGFVPEADFENSYFNLIDLINVIANGLSNWISSFNESPDKFTVFIERYDRILSDARHAVLEN
ncbi:MAG: hypothetical protein HRT52_03005 [Colwellia sp.]|nr:hypothetical protein [Colwellia sp.]